MTRISLEGCLWKIMLTQVIGEKHDKLQKCMVVETLFRV